MENEIAPILRQLEAEGRFGQERHYAHHIGSTVYAHSVSVAECSLGLADRLGLKVDRQSLIRGALLHDFFLYDRKKEHLPAFRHGITHPGIALVNAREDYPLNRTEENIILRHMFPLTPVPPACREAWIVSMADKCCAAREAAAAWRGIVLKRAARLFLRPMIS